MRIEDHEKRAISFCGEPFHDVHVWLDELYAVYGGEHRKYRHNEQGIAHIKETMGEAAAIVARQHIMDDIVPGGWHSEEGFPKDKEDYERQGIL
jgi:hypothetical protein